MGAGRIAMVCTNLTVQTPKSRKLEMGRTPITRKTPRRCRERSRNQCRKHFRRRTNQLWRGGGTHGRRSNRHGLYHFDCTKTKKQKTRNAHDTKHTQDSRRCRERSRNQCREHFGRRTNQLSRGGGTHERRSNRHGLYHFDCAETKKQKTRNAHDTKRTQDPAQMS